MSKTMLHKSKLRPTYRRNFCRINTLEHIAQNDSLIPKHSLSNVNFDIKL